MKIIIVGAGEVGRHVAKMLSNENHEILIMDSDEEHLQDLDSNYDMLSSGVTAMKRSQSFTPHSIKSFIDVGEPWCVSMS